MTSPHFMKELEDKKGMTDFGKSLLFMYRGMLEEGATTEEIIMVFSCYIASVAKSTDLEKDSD